MIFSQPDRGPAQQFKGCWKQVSIVDLDQASVAADTVLLALEKSAYCSRDVESMKMAWMRRLPMPSSVAAAASAGVAFGHPLQSQ